MALRLEPGRRLEKLLSVRLVVLHQHETKIQVGFEDVRLGRDGLSISGDGVIRPAKCVVDEAQIEPGLVVCRVCIYHFLQEGFGGRVVFSLNGAFGLDKLREQRGIVDGDSMMPHGFAAGDLREKWSAGEQYSAEP